MASQTVVLITGAGRGIGKALATSYLGRDNTIVVAAIRKAASAEALSSIPKGNNSKLIVVHIDSSEEKSATAAVHELVSKHSIDHLDIVIANAGIIEDYSPVANLPLNVLKHHVEVNSYGPLLLFQATLPLLEKASSPAKFIAIGSPSGSISTIETRPFPVAAYGISKAAVHYIVRKIHVEHHEIIAFVVDPGFVQTESGNSAAVAFGLKEAPTTIADSTKFLISTIEGATKEKTSGHFPSMLLQGGDFAW
ncbi:uncharacterized protein K452DRAFT_303398 [Aplosporella prunicola CBS 121167]|uniref:NAD(P)-binding protein n=1 Tax=Aplosporella prunicola CBS 121167 TaxID=1176127 RepID=A0A6A6AVM8_9PEZI|nr:uncharacterized protein K452DRAFT_303398 [Aplosporella prunicola CBS 121167]KAF2135646.1 hypothetical protein K452DRAFT_303398 [Aplosporella prunicola CBS 121167]